LEAGVGGWAEMILLINIAKEKLHYYEFVKPIEKILKEISEDYFVRDYTSVTSEDLQRAEKVIICGTSLYDNQFMEDANSFKWILDFDKPVLGICGGMQIIGVLFGGKIRKKTEIGFYFEEFADSFLGLEGKVEVYHLHNNYVDVSRTEQFIILSSVDDLSQAIMHRERDIYGVLFHPEVRNSEVIMEFVKNG